MVITGKKEISDFYCNCQSKSSSSLASLVKVMGAEEIRRIKIVLGGDGAVGKTSIRRRYLGEGFTQQYLQTLGADFALKETVLKDGNIRFRWQIWDLAGQPAFHEVRKAYFKGCLGALVVYDVTRPETLENAEKWCEDIWENSSYQEKIPIVLIGNKIDLRDTVNDALTPEDGKKMAEKLGIGFLETSAKTGENIEDAFEFLGRKIIEFTNKLMQRT